MTNPPPPTHSLTIPSLQGDTDLPCRIYHPPQFPPIPSCAIIAHPYAPMGGSYDDPIVLTLVDELTQLGYIVCTFNFRGGPGSRVGTSWTAKAETQDYISVVHFLISYTNSLNVLRSERDGAAPPERLGLLLSGYSYGAMVTTLLPPLSSFFPPPSTAPPTSQVSMIRTLSFRLACQASQSTTSEPRSSEMQFPFLSSIQTSYLLISPILGPIASLATMFNASSARVKGEEKFVAEDAGTLVVYGDGDTFTSAQRVTAWCEDIKMRRHKGGFGDEEGIGRGLDGREIQGAGHFWRERGVEVEMRRIVSEWAQTLLK